LKQSIKSISFLPIWKGDGGWLVSLKKGDAFKKKLSIFKNPNWKGFFILKIPEINKLFKLN
jgi:hypothetical protein